MARQLFGTTKPSIAGRVRDRHVRIAGSKHVPPESQYEVENELADLFEWYNREMTMIHPVLLACLMKLQFMTIHPYAGLSITDEMFSGHNKKMQMVFLPSETLPNPTILPQDFLMLEFY